MEEEPHSRREGLAAEFVLLLTTQRVCGGFVEQLGEAEYGLLRHVHPEEYIGSAPVDELGGVVEAEDAQVGVLIVAADSLALQHFAEAEKRLV
jgi:hypothetical protein